MNNKRNKTIIALGADIKSRFCIFNKGKLILSEEFGDLSNSDNFDRFKRVLLKAKVNPDIVAFDMHPGYFSSQATNLFATRNKITVQHHHAHIASEMFSRDLKKAVIGVAFDGTGFGSDGNLWGGEFMIVDKTGFKRLAHFKYLKMPGGESAVKEPWRMAFSILYDCLGKDMFKLELECLKVRPKKEYDILFRMLERNINSPLTSSAGRLFDAISSILGACHKVDFEAQAAIKLEKLAHTSKEKGSYELDILKQDNTFIIGYNKLIKKILRDIKDNLPSEDIARKFHNSLAEIIYKVVDKISSAYNLKDVVLSGGVFQNKILLSSTIEKLKEKGYNLIHSSDVPVNDLGICIGQVYVALNSK
jgi:hydrogenase maturation protein HypF